MSGRKHVVITGTGRTGTTFLVELLTHLGLDTGYRVDELSTRKHSIARAGLEHDIRRENCPYVVKSPYFCDYADEVLMGEGIVVEHLFVPVCDLFAAAESRRQVEHSTFSAFSLAKQLRRRLRPRMMPGGLWHARASDSQDQERILLEKLYRLLLIVSEYMVPTTFLQYPLLVGDDCYLYEKLRPILNGVSQERFKTAYDRTVKPELVHDFGRPRTA